MKKKGKGHVAYGMSEFVNPKNIPSMSKTHVQAPNKGYPTKGAIEKSGNEIKHNPPSILSHTKKKFGAKAAKRQRTAIMLSKARKGK